MIKAVVSARIFDLEALAAEFDASILDADFFDFLPELELLVDSGLIDTLPTSISSDAFVWEGRAPTEARTAFLTLSAFGTDLAPTDSLFSLGAALAAGAATGTIERVTYELVQRGRATVMPLEILFSESELTITSGDQEVVVGGTIPTGLQDVFELVEAIGDVTDITDVDDPAIDDLLDALDGLTVETVQFSNAGVPVGGLAIGADEIALSLGNLDLSVQGSFPVGPVGESLGIAIDLLRASLAGEDLPPIAGDFGIDRIRLTDTDGLLARIGGDFTDAEIAPVRVNGTAANDRAIVGDIPLIGLVIDSWNMFGGGGNDRLGGGEGRDILRGQAGNDVLFGEAGRDRLLGNNGADTIKGGKGADTLLGGKGFDELLGGGGNDLIKGQTGADRIDGQAGNDTLIGGAGADIFRIIEGGGHDIVRDFEDNVDTLLLDSDNWTGDLTRRQVIDSFSGLDADGNVVLTFETGATVTLEGITDPSVLYNDTVIL